MKRLLVVLGLLMIVSLLWSDGSKDYSVVSIWSGQDPNAGQSSFLSLLIPGGGKYEGMATAHTAMALDEGYLESNPASGSFLPNTILSFSHVDWIADSALETITFSYRPEKNENIGIGFNTKLFHVPFTGYDNEGSRYNRYNAAAVGWYTEFIATAAVSCNFLRSFYFGGISVGASIKAGYRGISATLDPGQNALVLLGDLGVLTRFNFLKTYASRDMNWGIGITIKNFGSEFIDHPDPLPTYASMGISYKPIRPLTIAFDVNIPFNLNGKTPEHVSYAVGINAEITPFLSAHSGVLIKTGKPRFTIGADVRLEKFTIQTNYTLDLSSRLELFDRMSIAIKIDMNSVKQLLIRDDVQELYLAGLEAYSQGKFVMAAEYFENTLSMDSTFQPAREMLASTRESVALAKELRQKLAY